MRYRVVNFSQQNANVLLKHLYFLPVGFLKSCLKQHSNMLSTEKRQLFDFMVVPLKLLLGPLLMQFFHRKPGRVYEAEGSPAPGLLRPGESPAFGVHATAHVSGVH